MQRIGVSAAVAGGSAINAGVETILATLGPIVPSSDSQVVMLLGYFEAIVNAMTAYTMLIRRGTTITGTVISENVALTAVGLAAGNSYRAAIMAIDNLLLLGPQFYVLTWNPTGANTNPGQAVFAGFLL